MDHQDWTPVVFKKKVVNKEKNIITSNGLPQYVKKLNDISSEDISNKYFEKDYINQVIAKRMEMKLTQKQLAINCNLDCSIIQRFEQGKEVYNHNLKNKLNKVLSIKNI